MLDVKIETDFDKLAKKMLIARSQMPFVLALTLTRVAQAAQDDLKADVVERFASRGKWVPGSIRIRGAKKGPSPESSVGTLYEPMAMHVEGGDKTAHDGRMVAIPIAARGKKNGRTTPNKWPGALLKKDGFYIDELGNGSIGVFQRMKRKSAKAKLWWVLTARVRVKKAWPWEELAGAAADRRLLPAFVESWDEAQAGRRL